MNFSFFQIEELLFRQLAYNLAGLEGKKFHQLENSCGDFWALRTKQHPRDFWNGIYGVTSKDSALHKPSLESLSEFWLQNALPFKLVQSPYNGIERLFADECAHFFANFYPTQIYQLPLKKMNLQGLRKTLSGAMISAREFNLHDQLAYLSCQKLGFGMADENLEMLKKEFQFNALRNDAQVYYALITDQEFGIASAKLEVIELDLRVGLLSSACIHPQHRRKKLYTHILQDRIIHARECDVDILLIEVLNPHLLKILKEHLFTFAYEKKYFYGRKK